MNVSESIRDHYLTWQRFLTINPTDAQRRKMSTLRFRHSQRFLALEGSLLFESEAAQQRPQPMLDAGGTAQRVTVNSRCKRFP